MANPGTYLGLDLDEILLLAGLVILIAVGLAIWLMQSQVAQIGIGLISAFTAPVSAVFNGIANAITAFFNWLAHSLGSLSIAKFRQSPIYMAATALGW